MSKHEDIIKYIRSLKVGTKISVRFIASELNVSDGTAYRAIKDAETLGIVTTVPRVGTVRIEKVEKRNIESLNYAEVVNIVEGTVLGGKDYLYKTLNKFVIGAMTTDMMKKYITPGNLLIVGNREDAQKLALENGCAVLITGGFGCSDEIKNLSNEKELPIISCSYDTFTTASMINKAISENLIKKDIILIEDIMKTDVEYVKTNNTIGDLKEKIKRTKHGRFPVIDKFERVAGIITIKDISPDVKDEEMVINFMTSNPITLTPKTSVAYAAHIMVWEGIELVPIVEDKKLVGVISREDVIVALQYINKQPQVGETIEDMVLKNFTYVNTDKGLKFTGKIVPEMLSSIGTASYNVLTFIMSTIGTIALAQRNHLNITVDSFTVFYVKPVQMDSTVVVNAHIIDTGRNLSKVEIEMIIDKSKELVGKALLSAKVLRK
ncbi:Predicted transcriptional regulator containing CBS domains [Caloramator quimbayensis]|uniref:Predicted transcriptional regulator containing CBS domains n=1 Tax=Caloramator quimbayensis TaxID=1147123 RepID=A0A1T4YAA0_9CLOT|nr:DRTGG domain-containing protein [Caloramator quimbayensis]SKA98448.1 Predicted transcriptional regulator containing CBS domains [Caloramator quimbayensis]